jgi:hypothetical protein
MTDDASTTAQDFQALCRQAGQRAARWQRAPAAPVERPPHRRLLIGALAAGACGLAVAAMATLATQLGGDPTQTPAPHAQVTSAPAAADRPGPIHWQGDELAMALDAVPLPQAAAWLAQATRSSVTGIELLKPLPVTLHHRGRDVNAAWRLLLQGQPAVALSCGATACHVWIGSEAPAAGPASTAPPRAHAGPGEEPDKTESQPDGSC